MKIRAFTVVALCLLLGWQDISAAHSTKGRVRVVLKKSSITADDVAYYIEPYVFEKNTRINMKGAITGSAWQSF